MKKYLLLFMLSFCNAFGQYYPPVTVLAQNPSGQFVNVTMDSNGNLYTNGIGSGLVAGTVAGYVPPMAMTAQGPTGQQIYLKTDQYGNLYVVGSGASTATIPFIQYPYVTMYGDSLVLGNQDGSGITICTVLSSLTSISCNSEGIAGDTSSAIAARMGAIAVNGTVTGNSIPASGGVTITFSPSSYAPITSSTTGSVLSSICNIPGTVTYTGSAYTFTRTLAGSITSCAAGSLWTPTTTGLLGGLVVIEAGTNNYTSPATVLSDVKAMYSTVLSAGGIPLVLSPLGPDLPGSWTNPYTIAHADLLAISDSETGAYYNNFINWHEMLESLYNSASTPDVYGWIHDITPISQRANEYAGTLSGNLNSSSCSFTTSFNGAVVASGTAEIDSEQILIEAASGGTVSTCIRGANGTTATSHTTGVAVTVVDGIHLGGATGYTYTAGLINQWITSNLVNSSRVVPSSTNISMQKNTLASLGLALEQGIPGRGVAYGSVPTGQSQVIAQLPPLTAQAANIAETGFLIPGTNNPYITTYTGWYTVCTEIDQTQVASASSTIPNVLIYWTRAVDGTATDAAWTFSNTVNAIYNSATNCLPIYAQTGTAIAYQTSGYASSGATPMQYAFSAYIKAY